jgi:predicted AlkP superfamily phosphohydrolase/phosphomutase
MTGKHPNKHGIFDFAKFDPEHYGWTVNNSNDIRSKTLWQLLSDKGKRVIVLNLPYTYPTYEVNGILVAGWDAPLTDAPFSYPAEISNDILRQFPDYKDNLWVSELRPLLSDAQFEEFTQRIKVGFEQQARIAMDLLLKPEWDVFMVHFQQTDWIQHKLWTYIEEGCKNPNNHDPKIDATRDCYRHFDNFVGQLIKLAEGFDPAIILLSDHGFGRLMGNIPANAYLKEWGYLAVQASSKERGGVRNVLRKSKYAPVRKLYQAAVAAKNHLASAQAVQKHDSWADNAQGVMSSRAASWDWTRTKAAMIYAYQMGFIYVNLASRGPRGIVQPGAEYEAIVADLIKRCKHEILHPETGDSLLLDAVRGSEIYPPADSGILVPDIVLIPRDGCNFSFSLSPSSPRVSEEGTHRHNGVLVMKSATVVKVRGDFHPNLIDLAPTILHLLGLPIPNDMDGRALEEILPSDWQANYEDADDRELPVADNYTHQEADIVAQRLKGLGYLD